jgi:hypothetical protein
MGQMMANGGEIILGGGSMASVQDSIMANGAKLKSTKITLSKLKSMIEEYNAQGRNFELRGAYNQLELWSNDNRIEAGSKEDVYRALVRYRFNPKYAKGAKLGNSMSRSEKWMSTIKKFPNLNEEYPQLMNMNDEEIITFVNTYSYYDRMDEGIEEEFDDINDAIEYLVLINE